jgi:hypothetical protein
MRHVVALMGSAALVALVASAPRAQEHAAVGADKCAKMCHKIQYESWAKTKHATGDKKVDCETCHGNGGDYIKIGLKKAKDPAAAKAAGLIAKPEAATCTKTCHKPAEVTPEFMTKVHAHKPKA